MEAFSADIEPTDNAVLNVYRFASQYPITLILIPKSQFSVLFLNKKVLPFYGAEACFSEYH